MIDVVRDVLCVSCVVSGPMWCVMRVCVRGTPATALIALWKRSEDLIGNVILPKRGRDGRAGVVRARSLRGADRQCLTEVKSSQGNAGQSGFG